MCGVWIGREWVGKGTWLGGTNVGLRGLEWMWVRVCAGCRGARLVAVASVFGRCVDSCCAVREFVRKLDGWRVVGSKKLGGIFS